MTKTLIRRKIRRYFLKKPEVLSAYLYGSQASGALREESDVDIAVVLKPARNLQTFTQGLKYRSSLEDLLKKDVDVVILNDADRFLALQVFSKGIPVYESNHTRAEDFKWRLVQEAWDYLPIKRIFDDAAIQRLRHGY